MGVVGFKAHPLAVTIYQIWISLKTNIGPGEKKYSLRQAVNLHKKIKADTEKLQNIKTKRAYIPIRYFIILIITSYKPSPAIKQLYSIIV